MFLSINLSSFYLVNYQSVLVTVSNSETVKFIFKMENKYNVTLEPQWRQLEDLSFIQLLMQSLSRSKR